MGLKIFINNIRYLARYNLKKMHNEKLDYKHFVKIANLLPYFDNTKVKKANILNVEDTIDLLINTNKSIVRYGDGEFALMDAKDIPFQKYNQKICGRLNEIFNNSNDNILIGISSIYFNIELYKYLDTINEFIFTYVAEEHQRLFNMIDYNKEYVSAEITQLYQLYKHYDFEYYFNKIKEIWNNKKLVIVCGETIFNNIDYNIFENSKSIDYIYAPSKNAFDKYDEILEKSLGYNKDKLFIIMLGPTATILAYDLVNRGGV